MAPPTTAQQQLKEQGNALFIKKDFARAHEKYTEAIAIDGQNAVLYANRSACCFGMGRFLDALRDAQQATEVDPTYAKGWSRRAAAHDAALEFSSAVWSWQKAVDVLPEANLTPAERQQKEQYTASLEKAKRRLEAASSQPARIIVIDDTEKKPWQVAEEMLPELQAVGRAKLASSAYMIYYANREFSEGVRLMRSLKKVDVPSAPNGFAIVGHTEGLTCISNGIMRDQRVFRTDDSDWFDKYNGQVCFETEKRKGWTSEGLEAVQQKALERLKKGGWHDVRPALAVVVRGWIMRALFDSQLSQAHHVAVERLKETLQLLHWGRQVWRGVSKEDRGVIFQDTFVRGVKSIYLEVLMAAHGKAAEGDKQALLDTLLEASRELVEDTGRCAPSSEPVDPGFVSSFYVYPAAQAYATSGYCLVQMAKSSENVNEKTVSYALAVKQYTQAALTLPDDDEKHCWYLTCAINPLLNSGASKSTVMGMVKAIRAAMPKMQQIWANSAFAKQGRDALIEETLRAAEGM